MKSARTVFIVMAGFGAVVMLSGCMRHPAIQTSAALSPVAPSGPIKVVLDSGDTSHVERVGDWPTGAGGDDWGDSCRFALKGKGECKFTWRPELPKAGNYRVSVWFGGDPNRDHATDSPFTVCFAKGKKTIQMNQTKLSDGWKALGVFPFEAGTSGYVELTNNANGNVVADGVQFELVK